MRYASVRTSSYSFKKLHAVWFEPSGPLLEKSTQSERVLAYLKNKGFKEPVYMITGVKIAEGASAITTSTDGKSHRFSLGANMTSIGFPLSFGPMAKRENQKIQNEAFEDSSPFVFAFRLKEIRLKERGPDIIAQDKTEGALYEAGMKKNKISVCSQRDEFSTEMLEEFDLEAHQAIDEDDDGECFAITASESLG
ncbi:hypothetical protein N7530_009802 [Penicillium desertorum]|uniref:Uncharacterized protein n=1 Tax=Penicillium desertorum TaxID=1303715 RepID=A0A9X0BIF8_9EURO|nr:hypothetical protein N7530_009802 [Penicillium desertorum]